MESFFYNIGIVNRMSHIFAKDGKTMVLAIDHRQRGIQDGIDDFNGLISLIEGIAPYIDAIMTTKEPLAQLIVSDSLRGKGLVLSLNRTGLANTGFEMDDRLVTSVETALKWGLDGVKLLIKFNKDNPFTNEQLTLLNNIVQECERWSLPLMVEPLYMNQIEGRLVMDRSYESIKWVSIITNDFHIPILKIPYVQAENREEGISQFKRIVDSVNAKILLLGGPRRDNPLDILRDFEDGIKAGASGFVVGRNVFLNKDPEIMAMAMKLILHNSYTAESAYEEAKRNVG
ncbi:MAG: class I fructose-bisphosphate aldolase [bacterium]